MANTANYQGRPQSWVEWFCSTPQGKYFVQIDTAFIRDAFNFYGLRQLVANYKDAIDMIRGEYIPRDQRPDNLPPDMDNKAIHLYGLLHARYLLTSGALREINKKYRNKLYEACPRVCCHGARCLPYGPYDDPGKSRLRMYCPCCHEVYISDDDKCQEIDGAYFGHSYLLLFLQQYPDVVKKPMTKTDVRLFGFKIVPEDEKMSESDSET